MSRVLLAADGSKPALGAEKYLSRAFDSHRDTVLIVSVAHVNERAMSYAGAAGHDIHTLGMDVNELREEAVEEARDIAEDAEGRLRGEGFDVQVAAPVGQPGPTICEWAKEEDVDCIVMGRRGRGLVGEVLLGSVSHYVVHHAPCPVTVVSAGEPAG